MKKIILFVLLVLVTVTASATKSYITVYGYFNSGKIFYNSENIIITGDMPNDIEGFEYDSKNHCWFNNTKIRPYSVGEILNVLSEYGYEVEFTNDSQFFLLSKETPSVQTLSEGNVIKNDEVNIKD